MVRMIGLEPTLCKEREPKSRASTNSATPACNQFVTPKNDFATDIALARAARYSSSGALRTFLLIGGFAFLTLMAAASSVFLMCDA